MTIPRTENLSRRLRLAAQHIRDQEPKNALSLLEDMAKYYEPFDRDYDFTCNSGEIECSGFGFRPHQPGPGCPWPPTHYDRENAA